jgi:hypothetical protein
VPSEGVPAGAPVLTFLSIFDPNTGARTDVGATTTGCATGVMEGGTCDPNMDAACRLMSSATTTTICGCDMAASTWTCSYTPQSVVVATFDRLLDTTPLDPGDSGVPGVTDVAHLLSAPPPPDSSVTLGTVASFDSTGSPTGAVFKFFLGINGPRLTVMGTPAVPANATVTFSLDGDKVRARDGHTPFTSAGPLLQDGVISFATVPFAVSLSLPQPPPLPDGGTPDPHTPVPADATPVTVAFNNNVDPTAILTHIQITQQPTGSAVAPVVFTDFKTDTSSGSSVVFTPNSTWPAGATIVVNVDAAAADLVGDTIGAASSEFFTTEAN